MIKLGKTVKDIVTGFTGIAISKIEYLNGCVQICVKPPVDEDGKMLAGEYIDIQLLEVIGDGVCLDVNPTGGVSLNVNLTGGVMPDAPSNVYTDMTITEITIG